MTFEEKVKSVKEFFDSFSPDEFCDMLEHDYGIIRERELSFSFHEGFCTVLDDNYDTPFDCDESEVGELYCVAA